MTPVLKQVEKSFQSSAFENMFEKETEDSKKNSSFYNKPNSFQKKKKKHKYNNIK